MANPELTAGRLPRHVLPTDAVRLLGSVSCGKPRKGEEMEWVKVTRSGAAPEGGYRISCEEREGHDAEIKTSAPTGESRRDGRLGSRGAYA